jgi:hypothetical protein
VFSVCCYTFPGNGSASGSSPLFTASRTELSLTLSLAYNISARTTQKTQLFHCYSPTFELLRVCCLATGTCLPSRCPEMAIVYPPISRPLHSNGSTRYSSHTGDLVEDKGLFLDKTSNSIHDVPSKKLWTEHNRLRVESIGFTTTYFPYCLIM